VLDYLYKHEEKFSKVIILNLFALCASVFDTGIEHNIIFENGNIHKNNKIIVSTIATVQQGDRVIAAWGGYPERNGFRQHYRNRIEEVMMLLQGIQLWRVGDIVKDGSHRFPQHGLNWFDFEEMKHFIP